MRSAPRAARATAGFCKPASQSSTAGVRAAVGSSELTSFYAFGFVPGAVPQVALAMASFGKLVSHNALGTVPMRSAPRAARATVGFSKPTSHYAFGFVPGAVHRWHWR